MLKKVWDKRLYLRYCELGETEKSAEFTTAVTSLSTCLKNHSSSIHLFIPVRPFKLDTHILKKPQVSHR